MNSKGASSPDAASGAAESSAFTHPEILRIIGGILLCILLAALDQTVVIPAVPAIAGDLHGFDHVAWIVSAYLITATVSTPIYGKLSDSYGRRQLLTVSIGVFIVTSILCGLAQSMTQLIVFRALQGLGGGGLMTLAQAAIADVVAPRQRGRYQGYLAGVWAMSSIAGPVVGGYISQHFSWRLLFDMNVPLGLLAMWTCNRGLRKLRPKAHPVRLDLVGILLLASVIVLSLLALGWAGTAYAWVSLPILGLFGLALLCLAVLVVQQGRAPAPILPPRLFRRRTFNCAVTTSTLASMVIFICIFSLPLYFQFVHGMTAAGSGLFVAPYLVAVVSGNIISSSLARRSGKLRGNLMGGAIVGAFGLLILAVVSPSVSVIAVIFGMLLAGVGIGSMMVGTLMAGQNAIEINDLGAGTGTLLLLRSMGSAFGAALAGSVLSLGLNSAMENAGLHQHLDLGELRDNGALLASLPIHTREILAHGVASGFHVIFAIAALIALACLGIVRAMPNLELRNTPAVSQMMGD